MSELSAAATLSTALLQNPSLIQAKLLPPSLSLSFLFSAVVSLSNYKVFAVHEWFENLRDVDYYIPNSNNLYNFNNFNNLKYYLYEARGTRFKEITLLFK